MATLTLTMADEGALRVLFDDQLSKGRAFVPGEQGVAERERCDLVIEHSGRAHHLAAEVVHVRREDPGRGTGLQLARLDADAQAALRLFVEGPTPPAAAEPEEPEEPDTPQRHANLSERMQALTGPEQLKLAAAGTLQERVALERMYGPAVWETLLRNSRLTPPEAARIAKKGTLPRPLVELIAANSAWLAVGEVQRALLSNPRSSPSIVQRVLRMMPRSDLQLVPHQTAYPVAVRQAAKSMLGR